MSKPWIKRSVEVSYDLKPVLEIVRQSDAARTYETRRVATSIVDYFLLSGRFNSVLGPDGFSIFKDRLKDVIQKVNDDDFGASYINLDKMFEALLASGVYYIEEYLPEDLEFLKKDVRWLTAYRYVAKNFPDITYQAFREITKRFQESNGHSIYVSPDDSEVLQAMADQSDLFHEVVDARAALLQLNQKQLRAICDSCGAAPARKNEETIDRIIEKCGDGALKHIPAEFKTRRSLLIKDLDLATGEDIIHLDSYLRTIAKVVREDLVDFIDRRRNWTLLETK